MESALRIPVVLMMLPVLLFLFEFYLSKKNSKFASTLPVLVACCFAFVGFYAVIIAAIMFAIYFIVKHIEKEKKEEKSELDKMSIQDLE